ncbi:DinB family protein [Tsukamurella sp. 1534]|uniref:DinB family protein n=1 Tax=Tsukamurella sp. 1534 TaxID=1151061 RepID=UPI0002FBD9BA|nr:DinB family protein [Tsukamurella sp. 1534]
MPFMAPAADNERAGLRGFLVQQLDGVRHTSFGLTEEQIRLSPARSALSVGGLLKHVTLTVNGWASRAEAAPEVPDFDPEVDGAVECMDFIVTDDESLASLLTEFDEASARILAVAETKDLEAVAPVPNAPWFPKDLDGWSVRWILLHVIEEVARHAGHADIIREQVDGATMYELIAAAENTGDLGFVQPWTPPEQ